MCGQDWDYWYKSEFSSKVTFTLWVLTAHGQMLKIQKRSEVKEWKIWRFCCRNKQCLSPIISNNLHIVYLHICMDFALGWDAQNHCSMLHLGLILHTFNIICKHLFALNVQVTSLNPSIPWWSSFFLHLWWLCYFFFFLFFFFYLSALQ